MSRGLTLVEVVVSVALLAVLVGGVAVVLAQTLRDANRPPPPETPAFLPQLRRDLTVAATYAPAANGATIGDIAWRINDGLLTRDGNLAAADVSRLTVAPAGRGVRVTVEVAGRTHAETVVTR